MINFLLGFLTADFILTIFLFLNLKFFYNKSYYLFLILGLIDVAIIIFLLYIKNAKEK